MAYDFSQDSEIFFQDGEAFELHTLQGEKKEFLGWFDNESEDKFLGTSQRITITVDVSLAAKDGDLIVRCSDLKIWSIVQVKNDYVYKELEIEEREADTLASLPFYG